MIMTCGSAIAPDSNRRAPPTARVSLSVLFGFWWIGGSVRDAPESCIMLRAGFGRVWIYITVAAAALESQIQTPAWLQPQVCFLLFLKTKGAAGDFYLVYLHQKRFSEGISNIKRSKFRLRRHTISFD